MWTAHNRSFLGMTAHWIDPVTLHQCKAALACTRVTGRHTYDVLGARIEQIHNFYGLAGKITATITDNGSNFVKAFTVFHHSSLDSSSATAEEIPTLSMDEDPEESLENTDTEDVIFENMDQMLTVDTENDLTQVQYDLPAHERCAAHTLSLIATTDIDKYLSTSPVSRNIYRSSFAKCSAVWNKTSRSTVASDSVQEIANRKFLVPSKTRWNSHYDAILRITENTTTELNELCTRMGLRSFAEKEIVFLKEYCSVLKPLARGLDILQGEDNCFYGTLLPTLETIIKKIKALIFQLSTATVGLVYTIESSIKHRFAKVFESNNAIIAAITLPKFKLKWVDDQRKKDQFKQVLMQEIRLRVDDDVTETENPAQPEAQASSNAEKDHFYEFDSDEDSTSQNTIESEVNDYLSNAKQYECLNKYP